MSSQSEIPPGRKLTARRTISSTANAVLGVYTFLFGVVGLIGTLAVFVGAFAFGTNLLVIILQSIPDAIAQLTYWAGRVWSLPPIYAFVAAFLVILFVAYFVADLTALPPPRLAPKLQPPPPEPPPRRLTSADGAKEISERLLARHRAMRNENDSRSNRPALQRRQIKGRKFR